MFAPNPSSDEIMAAVFGPTDVFLAYAYGSRVHGNPRPDSDLDIGYYLDDFRRHPPLSIKEEMMLAGELSDRMGVEVDLRNLGEAPLEWRGRVLEDGVRVYCRDEVQRVNLERDLLAQYLDQKDSFRRMHELRLRRFAESGL
jgi:predicted nucleotidyltransferase